MSAPDDGYSKNVSCAQNQITTFSQFNHLDWLVRTFQCHDTVQRGVKHQLSSSFVLVHILYFTVT